VALLLIGISATTASQTSSLSEPPRPEVKIGSSREFDRLRRKARTAGDFTALAEWCAQQASHYREDKAKNEAELQQYNATPHTENPKFRSTGDILKAYIANDEKAAARWTKLADQYSEQARKAAATKELPVAP
jgi:hypothetical protein